MLNSTHSQLNKESITVGIIVITFSVIIWKIIT